MLGGHGPKLDWCRRPVVSPADATRGQQRAASAWASCCLPGASWCARVRRGLRDISISMGGTRQLVDSERLRVITGVSQPQG